MEQNILSLSKAGVTIGRIRLILDLVTLNQEWILTNQNQESVRRVTNQNFRHPLLFDECLLTLERNFGWRHFVHL